MDIKNIDEGFKKRLKEGLVRESISKRAREIKKLLKRGIEQGRYTELEDINANLNDVAYTLAYTESEKAFVEKVIQERTKFKNYPSFKNLMEKDRMKMLFLKRSGKEKAFLNLPVKERMELLKKHKKYPEWYLKRAALDLGSYFEALPASNSKKFITDEAFSLTTNTKGKEVKKHGRVRESRDRRVQRKEAQRSQRTLQKG